MPYDNSTKISCAGSKRLFFSRYLVFYSPFDLVYKIARMLPFKMVLCGFKEVQRAHKVYHAVSHTAKLYPNSYLVIIIIGTVKGKNITLVDFSTLCHFVCAILKILEKTLLHRLVDQGKPCKYAQSHQSIFSFYAQGMAVIDTLANYFRYQYHKYSH